MSETPAHLTPEECTDTLGLSFTSMPSVAGKWYGQVKLARDTGDMFAVETDALGQNCFIALRREQATQVYEQLGFLLGHHEADQFSLEVDNIGDVAVLCRMDGMCGWNHSVGQQVRYLTLGEARTEAAKHVAEHTELCRVSASADTRIRTRCRCCGYAIAKRAPGESITPMPGATEARRSPSSMRIEPRTGSERM
jgi:hypothetical protein